SGMGMDECEKQKKAVKFYLQKRFEATKAFWQDNSDGLILPITIVALVILWGFWGLGGGKFFIDQICKSDEDCQVLGKLASLGDVFGGVNALFAGIALAAVAVSTDLARKAFTAERQWIKD